MKNIKNLILISIIAITLNINSLSAWADITTSNPNRVEFDSQLNNSLWSFGWQINSTITFATNSQPSYITGSPLVYGAPPAIWNILISLDEEVANVTATTTYSSPSYNWSLNSPVNSLTPIMNLTLGNLYHASNDENMTISSIVINNDTAIAGVFTVNANQEFSGITINNSMPIHTIAYTLTVSTPNVWEFQNEGLPSLQNFTLIPKPGWQQTIETTNTQPTYPPIIAKETGKDSLIVVTHGYIPPGETAAESTAWIDTTTNAICQYLVANSLTNWQVAAYRWIDGAQVFFPKGPQTAVGNAQRIGDNMGLSLATQGWTNLHLIAHSAGSILIQAVSEMVKASSSSNTTVHCTFLDPFLGLDYAGVTNYGKGADWADSYFTKDLQTGGDAFQWTEGPLLHAYNVDVTQLDVSNRIHIQGFISTASGDVSDGCYHTKSVHGWPTDFYLKTIPTNTLSGSDGLGFPRSKEAGGWNIPLDFFFPPGNTPPRELGTPDPVCMEYLYPTTPMTANPALNFSLASHQRSDTGGIDFTNGLLRLTTDSPAWLATLVSLSNTVNTMSFDAQFESSAGAQGLLTVYWDTNVLGVVDERVVQPGLQHYLFTFPAAMSNSVHVIGFRIDPFTNITSTVMITNVVMGFSGVSQPFNLSVTTTTVGGLPVFQLSGESGFTYSVQASPDLITWTNIITLANTNGTVRFYDQDSPSFGNRFYRALAPQ